MESLNVTTLGQTSIEQFFSAWTTGADLQLPIVPCRSSDLYQAYCRYCEYHKIKERPHIYLNGFLLAQNKWEIKQCKLTHWEDKREITTIERVVFPPENLVPYCARDKGRLREDYIPASIKKFKQRLDRIFPAPAVSPPPP